MSLSTVALTRCPAETGFLSDETDVIKDTVKGSRSAQDAYYVHFVEYYKACISLAVCVLVFCEILAIYINPVPKKN